MRMAAHEGISQEAIEAGILAARPAMFPQAVPLTAEGASPITAEAVVATPTGLTPQTRTEEYGIQQQLRHFDRLSPGYAGKGTAIDAEDWMRKITKNLDTMVITADSDRVRLAAFKFEATADEWWEGQTRTRTPESFTWRQFTDAFYERFFPMATRQDLAQRFSTLYRGPP